MRRAYRLANPPHRILSIFLLTQLDEEGNEKAIGWIKVPRTKLTTQTFFLRLFSAQADGVPYLYGYDMLDKVLEGYEIVHITDIYTWVTKFVNDEVIRSNNLTFLNNLIPQCLQPSVRKAIKRLIPASRRRNRLRRKEAQNHGIVWRVWQWVQKWL